MPATQGLPPNPKLCTLAAAVAQRKLLYDRGQKLVLTNGCFDLLHPGHLYFLNQAAALGDQLWIALNSNSSVQALKDPKRPLLDEHERAYALAALENVDRIVIFDTPHLAHEIRSLQPDIYVKAGDYTLETLNVEECIALETIGTTIRFLPFLKGYSTTGLIDRMAAAATHATTPYAIVILGSGRGSNAEAILKAQAQKRLARARVAAIISDQPEAPILQRGPRFGIPADYVDPGPFKTKLDEDATSRYIDHIKSFHPDLLVLAGFMRVVNEPFIRAFHGKLINIHPSLLPSFPGLNSIQQALDYGVVYTGCTVHWVTPEVDAGPIIDQKVVRIDPSDDLASLESKVHATEHELLPEVIARLSYGQL